MNAFISMIKERRSVREYTNKKIEREILEEIIDCARLAPSSRNMQPWNFLVVTHEETLLKISEFAALGSPFIKNAAACIAVCGTIDAKRHVEDCCLAAENIMLAAKSFGIGSCYVAAMGKDVDGARKLLEIPDDQEIVCFITLGYFEKNPPPPAKKRLKDVIRWEKY